VDADDGAWIADDDEVVYWDVANIFCCELLLKLVLGHFGLGDWVVEAFFFGVVFADELLEVGVKGDGAGVIFDFDDVDGALG